jgi:hypothetical protein
MATPQEKIGEILDGLNDSQIAEVIDFAEYLKSKNRKKSWDEMPIDNEPLSNEEITAIKEGEKELEQGHTLSYKDVFGE